MGGCHFHGKGVEKGLHSFLYFCKIVRELIPCSCTCSSLVFVKYIFLKLTTFFISINRHINARLLIYSESLAKTKARLTWKFFYVSSFLQTNTYEWKWHCAIFSKFHMLWRWPKPFWKVIIKIYKILENDLYNFRRRFNFKILFTLKLLTCVLFWPKEQIFLLFWSASNYLKTC